MALYILVLQRSLVAYRGTCHESLVFSRCTHEHLDQCLYQEIQMTRARALQNYFLPCHIIYSDQHNQCDTDTYALRMIERLDIIP